VEKASHAPANPTLQHILKNGELVVGMAANMPPLNMKNKAGKVIGYEADLSKYIADAMGVDLRIETVRFNELLAALESGEVDMVLSGMTITPQRNLKVAFVGPYVTSGKCILTKVESLAEAEDGSKIKAKDKTFAVLRGSTSQDFVENEIKGAKIALTDNYEEAVDLVLKNKADAMIADYALCSVSVLRYPDSGLMSVFTLLTYEPLGIAIPANDPLMVNWLENLLNTLDGNGKLEALRTHWFENASWLEEMK
jgi:polar amino acid transport system substrate-binding protein